MTPSFSSSYLVCSAIEDCNPCDVAMMAQRFQPKLMMAAAMNGALDKADPIVRLQNILPVAGYGSTILIDRYHL